MLFNRSLKPRGILVAWEIISSAYFWLTDLFFSLILIDYSLAAGVLYVLTLLLLQSNVVDIEGKNALEWGLTSFPLLWKPIKLRFLLFKSTSTLISIEV